MGEVNLVNVSKHFVLRIDSKVQAVKALDRVSFSVHDGEIVVLIGPSGCGKTTALRVAMGLEPASGGKVTVDGREVKGCGHDRGMVFQFAELLRDSRIGPRCRRSLLFSGGRCSLGLCPDDA